MEASTECLLHRSHAWPSPGTLPEMQAPAEKKKETLAAMKRNNSGERQTKKKGNESQNCATCWIACASRFDAVLGRVEIERRSDDATRHVLVVGSGGAQRVIL